MSKQADVLSRDGGAFLRGLLTGMALVVVLLVMAAGVVASRGIVVSVETGGIARHMEEEVRRAVRREVPAVLATMKAELPQRVAAEAGRRLSGARIDLGGFAVPIPPGAVQQVERTLQQALQVGLEGLSGEVDVEGIATRLSQQAGRLADEQIRTFLVKQTFTVELLPGLPMPVRIQPR